MIKQEKKQQEVAKDQYKSKDIYSNWITFRTRTIIHITNNISKIRNQVEKVKKLPDLINEAKRNFEEILEYLRVELAKADEVGKRCYDYNHMVPKDIFDNYETLPKKSPEEVAALNLAMTQHKN